jgi:hypothetical protein
MENIVVPVKNRFVPLYGIILEITITSAFSLCCLPNFNQESLHDVINDYHAFVFVAMRHRLFIFFSICLVFLCSGTNRYMCYV